MGAYTLHYDKAASSATCSSHAMSGMSWHFTVFSWPKQIVMTWRPRLHQHGTIETDKAVGDFAVVMPGDFFSRRKGQYLNAQIRRFCDQFSAFNAIGQIFRLSHGRHPFSRY